MTETMSKTGSTTATPACTEVPGSVWACADSRHSRGSHRTTPSDSKFEMGGGATLRIGTDAHAYTVTAISPSGKTITMQRDKATISPDFKADFTPGGFVGHVSNSYAQAYTYERDTDGPVRQARLTKTGWRSLGTPVVPGRHEFYDFNF